LTPASPAPNEEGAKHTVHTTSSDVGSLIIKWWWCYPTPSQVLRDRGVEELHGDPTVGSPYNKVGGSIRSAWDIK